jgi:hypothetical protein
MVEGFNMVKISAFCCDLLRLAATCCDLLQYLGKSAGALTKWTGTPGQMLWFVFE